MIVGVPDSKLADWLKDKEYIIATDEGEAIAIAAGYYLATGNPATVFMQSDGYSNALNAITTLMMPYGIPFEPKLSVRTDEPQHEIMGKKIHRIIELINDQRTGD